MNGTAIALVLLVMLSAGGVAYALLQGRLAAEKRSERRLDQIQARRQAATVSRARPNDPAKRRRSVQDTLKEMEERQKAKARQGTSPPLALRIQQAGLTWSRNTFLLFSACVGMVVFILCVILGLPLYASAALAFAGLLGLPRWFVNFRRKRRFQKFLDEFPNAVDVIVRGIKAGLPLNDCVRMIGAEAAEPVRSEFRLISEAQAMGVALPDAINRLPERVPVPEAGFFAIVIAVQSKAGGNLSEALGSLSRVMRERKKMKGKISAMSMEAKASAYIIGSLPIVVMALVYLTSPNYIMILFQNQLGHIVLGASALWMAIGILMMKKMINFDF